MKLIKDNHTTNPKLALWYFDIDMNRSDVAISPLLNPWVKKDSLHLSHRELRPSRGLMEAILIQAPDASYSALIEPRNC
ncbi:MAG: hypothetical protein IPG53_06255 [Ignavibacteriales bacterium]|nr:hypothetical protein [Ignavibacteriales bacterium]